MRKLVEVFCRTKRTGKRNLQVGVECDFVANLGSSRIYIQSVLNLVMLDANGKGSYNFPSIMIQKTGVFKIEVTDFFLQGAQNAESVT